MTINTNEAAIIQNPVWFITECSTYDMLKDLLVFNKVDVFSSSTVKAVKDASVIVKTPDGEKEIKADTVMIAVGYHSQKDLYDSMKDSKKIVYITGDSRKVHNIMDAIWGANQLAREL